MGSFSIWHWLIVLAIVAMVFGTSKLRTIGSDLGGAVKNFKDAVKDGEADAHREAANPPVNQLGSQSSNANREQKAAEQNKV